MKKLSTEEQVKLTLLEIRYELEVLLKKRIDISSNDYYQFTDGNYFVSTLMTKYGVKLTFIDMEEFNNEDFNHHLFESVDEAMQTDASDMTDDDSGFKQAIKSINYFLNHILGWN